MQKIKKIFSLFALSLVLTSCNNPNVPQDILKFIDNMSFLSAVKTHLIGELEFNIQYFENDIIKGTNEGTFTFNYLDTNNYSSLVKQTFSGIYLVNDIKASQEYVVKVLDQENKYHHYKTNVYTNDTTQNEIDEIVNADYIMKIFQDSFFGIDNNGVYTNGMYYGDTLYYMKDYYYNNMTINEDDTMTFSMPETYIPQDATYIQYNYIVDSYGMMLIYHNEMFDQPNDAPDYVQRKVILDFKIDYQLTNID